MGIESFVGPFVYILLFLLTSWGTYHQFQAGMKEWKRLLEEWKKDIETRVRATETIVASSTQAVMAEKVRRLERDYETMHNWKNSILPKQLETAADTQLKFIERVERDLDKRVTKLEQIQKGNV